MSNTPISRFEPPELKDLPEDIAQRIAAVQEKSGFVSRSRAGPTSSAPSSPTMTR